MSNAVGLFFSLGVVVGFVIACFAIEYLVYSGQVALHRVCAECGRGPCICFLRDIPDPAEQPPMPELDEGDYGLDMDYGCHCEQPGSAELRCAVCLGKMKTAEEKA